MTTPDLGHAATALDELHARRRRYLTIRPAVVDEVRRLAASPALDVDPVTARLVDALLAYTPGLEGLHEGAAELLELADLMRDRATDLADGLLIAVAIDVLRAGNVRRRLNDVDVTALELLESARRGVDCIRTDVLGIDPLELAP